LDPLKENPGMKRNVVIKAILEKSHPSINSGINPVNKISKI